MRLASAREIAEGVARRMGRSPDSADGISTVERSEMLGYAADVLGDVWEWAWWPELCRVRRRRLAVHPLTGSLMFAARAPDYNSTRPTVEGDEVFYNGVYWLALQDSAAGVFPVEGSNWTRIHGYAPIGSVRRVVWGRRTLEVRPGYGEYYVESARGLGEGSFVDVEFRIPEPALTGKAWDEEVSYDRGAAVYCEEDGHCYRSLQDGNLGKEPSSAGSVDWWEKTRIPAYFRRALCTLATAEAYYSDDRLAEGDRQERKGMDALSILRDRMTGHAQGETAVVRGI